MDSPTTTTFDCELFLGSTEWEVSRQTPVAGPEAIVSDLSWNGRIDVYLTNDEWGRHRGGHREQDRGRPEQPAGVLRPTRGGGGLQDRPSHGPRTVPSALEQCADPMGDARAHLRELFTQLEIEQTSLDASPGDRMPRCCAASTCSTRGSPPTCVVARWGVTSVSARAPRHPLIR